MSWYNPSDWDWGSVGNYIFGGGATKGIDAKPAHGDYMSNYIQDQLGGINGRQAPQFQSADSSYDRGQTLDLAGRLQGIANGNHLGAGEMAVNRQLGQAQAAQQAQASAARGQNAALAMRQAARNQADLGVNGAGLASQAALGDQTAANQQLGGLYNQLRGQDIGIGQGNQQMQFQQNQLNQQGSLGYLSQLLGIDQAQLQAELAKAGIAAGDKGVFPYMLQTGGAIAAKAV
jgi:hypothetical protein